MVALDRIHVYAWDARPYPAFPNDLEVWGDGGIFVGAVNVYLFVRD